MGEGGDQKDGKDKKKTCPYEDDAKVPAGSWIQHFNDNHMFWRNNDTGETARGLWYEHDLHPGCRHLKPAAFAKVTGLKSPKPKSPDKENKEIIIGLPVYEEFHDPKCGKKHWKHRETGKVKLEDPYN